MPPHDSALPEDRQALRRIWVYPLVACAAALPLCLAGGFQNLTALFLRGQDIWLLLLATIAAFAACQRIAARPTALILARWQPAALALALVLICYAGHHALLSGYAMSRDEQMALFDAGIFAGGRLTAPLPAPWVQHGDALNMLFMLPVEHPSAWVSSYLPMNAALHALVGLVADPALTGPLLIGIGAIALYGCAHSLWPDRPEAGLVALLLYALSGQILITGMTSYAMSAHLALNLVWLWLFLRGRTATDLAALAVGFVATGLHQPLFHPLFAAPILILLLRDRAWRRAALFATGYAAICLFWLAWPQWMAGLVSGPESRTAARGVDYVTRLIDVVRAGDEARLANMAANLLRFIAWQQLLLLPLIAAARPAMARGGLPAMLAWGAVLPVAVVLVILPYQGHGFGYRYLHGVTGNLILLACYGWIELGDRVALWRPALIRLTIAGALLMVPIQAWFAHGFYAPFARASQAIERSGADYAVIDADAAPFAQDLVINRADLSNRPIRLLANKIDPDLPPILCREEPKLIIVDGKALGGIRRYFGGSDGPSGTPQAATFTAAGCRVGPLR